MPKLFRIYDSMFFVLTATSTVILPAAIKPSERRIEVKRKIGTISSIINLFAVLGSV